MDVIGWMVWLGVGVLLGVGICKFDDVKRLWIERQIRKTDSYIEIPMKVRK